MITFHSRRATFRLAAALGTVFVAGSLMSALPATAAEPGATMTITKTSGTLEELSTTKLDFTTNLACGEGNTMIMFLADAGSEVVTVAAEDPISVFNGYAFYKKLPFNVDPDSGTPFPGSQLPTIITRGADSRSVPLGDAMDQPNHSYSLGLACGITNNILKADGSGHSIGAWVTLTTDATGGWTLDVPKTATTTSLTAVQQGTNDALLTATVAPADATGTVDFTEAGVSVADDVAVTSGVATTVVKGVDDGSHSYTATYTPAADSNFSGSTADASVTISKVKVATTVELTGTPVGFDGIGFTATVKSAAGTATDATGTVEFWSGGEKKGDGTYADGVATYSATGLTDGQSYSYTAKYVPAAEEANYSGSESAVVAVAVPALPKELKAGDTIEAGGKYRVEFKADTFEPGAELTAEVHSDPIALDDKATVADDGSARYIFTAPAALEAGSSHELVVTDGTTTETVAFVVAKAPPADDNGDGDNGGGNGTGDGNNGGNIPKTGGNDPASFATDWIAANGSNPVGLAAIIGSLLAAGAAAVAGSWLIWRRRKQA